MFLWQLIVNALMTLHRLRSLREARYKTFLRLLRASAPKMIIYFLAIIIDGDNIQKSSELILNSISGELKMPRYTGGVKADPPPGRPLGIGEYRKP